MYSVIGRKWMIFNMKSLRFFHLYVPLDTNIRFSRIYSLFMSPLFLPLSVMCYIVYFYNQ